MNMDDLMMPKWVREIKEEQIAEAEASERQAQSAITLAALVKGEGLTFWRQLVKELWFVGESCKGTGFEVFIDDTSGEEEAFQVRVASTSILPIGELRSRFVNVFYSPDQYRIRCHPQVGDSFCFDFCIYQSVLHVCYRGQPLKPEEVANQIIKPLVQTVRGRRH